MSMKLTKLMGRWMAVMGAVSCGMAGEAAAGSGGSLSDLNLEVTEAKLTLDGVSSENEMLRKKLTLAQESVRSLTESLAIANSEAEVFRRQSTELKLRLEALGVEAAGSDRSKLEQRLLKAARDLQLLQNDRDKIADQLVKLTEAVLTFSKTAVSTDADARLALETEMRGSSQTLGVPGQAAEAAAVPATLTDGMVISIKEEYALVVANLGSRQGVKIGMPFQVWRGDERVGLVRVVDVREIVSGAVVQDLKSTKDKIKLGDRLRVDAQP